MANITQHEKTALAIVRMGGSFEDASKATGVPVDRIMRLYAAH